MTFEFDLDEGVAVLLGNSEGPVDHVSLNFGVIETTADETLSVKDGVLGVHGSLILGGITNQTLVVREGDVGGGGAVALFVGNDFNALRLPDTNAGVAS